MSEYVMMPRELTADMLEIIGDFFRYAHKSDEEIASLWVRLTGAGGAPAASLGDAEVNRLKLVMQLATDQALGYALSICKMHAAAGGTAQGCAESVAQFIAMLATQKGN